MTINVIILPAFLDDNLPGSAFLNHDSCFFTVLDGFRLAFTDVAVFAADVFDSECRVEAEFSVPLFEIVSGSVDPVNPGKEFGGFPLAPFAVVGPGPVGIPLDPDGPLDFDAVQSVCLGIYGLLAVFHVAPVDFVFKVRAPGLLFKEMAPSVFDDDLVPVNFVQCLCQGFALLVPGLQQERVILEAVRSRQCEPAKKQYGE